MKIAAVSNDGTTISAHFGKARYYVVITVEDGVVVNREQRDRSAPAQNVQNTTPGPLTHHDRVLAPIADCQVALAQGMGGGMYQQLRQAGVRPILTDVVDIDEAVSAFIAGQLRDLA